MSEQLEKIIEEERRENSFLIRFSTDLHKKNTSFDVIDTTYHALREYIGDDLTNMALLRPRRQRVKKTSQEGEETTETIDTLLVEATAPNNVEIIGERVPFGTGVTGQAASKKTLRVLDDIKYARPEEYLSPDEREHEGSEIAVPLLAEGELIGVLEGQSRTPFFFDTYSRGLFGKIGSIVSAKLQGVADIEKDGLCKEIYNKQTFEKILQLEIRYAIKGNGNLTLAVCDLDNFKKLNDECGHIAGDKAIRYFGAALKDSVRESDLVSRIGGDEFAIIFPDTTYEEAMVAMEHASNNLQKILLEENIESAKIFMQAQTTPLPSYGLGSLSYYAKTQEIDLTTQHICDMRVGAIADAMYKEADNASYDMKRERKELRAGPSMIQLI